MRKRSDPSVPRPLLLTIVLVGLATGWSVAQVGEDTLPREAALRASSWFTIWSACGALCVALYLLIFLFGYRQIASSELDLHRISWTHWLGWLGEFVVLISAAFAGVSLVTSRLSLPEIPLTNAQWRIAFFTLVAILAAAPSAIGLWIVSGEITFVTSHWLDGGSPDQQVYVLRRYLKLTSLIPGCLTAMATALTAGVVQTSFLRSALIDSGTVSAATYPPEFVTLYGGAFAAAIALVYVPSQMQARYCGACLRDCAAERLQEPSTAEVGRSEIEEWLKDVQGVSSINSALGLDSSLLQKSQAALGVLAPFLATFVTGFLHF